MGRRRPGWTSQRNACKAVDAKATARNLGTSPGFLLTESTPFFPRRRGARSDNRQRELNRQVFGLAESGEKI